MFAICDKHYPSRSGQTSLAIAVTNFTKPRTSHFFDLCTCPLYRYDTRLNDIEKPLELAPEVIQVRCCSWPKMI